VRSPGLACWSLLRAYGITRQPLHLGTNIVWCIAGEGAAAHRRRTASLVDAAAIDAGGVAGEGAAADRHRSVVVEAAAEAAGGVAGEGAVAHRRRTGLEVEEAAAQAGGVAGEGAVAHRQRPDAGEAAAAVDGGVAGEGAAAHRRRTAVVDAAAEGAGGVAGEGAVAHRRRTATLVVEAAAVRAGGVAGENAVADRQRPGVVNAAAVSAAGIASLDRQAGDVHGLTRIDRKDAEGGSGWVPLHGRLARCATCDGDVPVQVQQGAFQGDRFGAHDLDDVTVIGRSLIGRRNGVPQGVFSRIVRRRDIEGDHTGNRAAFQLFQGQALPAKASAGPPRGASKALG